MVADKPTIGIVGLGMIGGGMAGSAVRAGHRVVGYDIAEAACERARAQGVEAAADLHGVVAEADIIVVSLASPGALQATWQGADGILQTAEPGKITIETSTVAPAYAGEVTAAATARGLRHVEASVVGIGKDADAGALYYYTSGDHAAVAAAVPFFAATGRGHAYLGPSGAAAIAKVLNNAIGYTTVVAIAEALAVAKRHGIDLDQFVRVVREGRGAGDSVVFQRHAEAMANYSAQEKGDGTIYLKDTAALADLLAATDGRYDILEDMIAKYRAALTDGGKGPIEMARYADRGEREPPSDDDDA